MIEHKIIEILQYLKTHQDKGPISIQHFIETYSNLEAEELLYRMRNIEKLIKIKDQGEKDILNFFDGESTPEKIDCHAIITEKGIAFLKNHS